MTTEERKEYNKAYRLKNIERIRKYQREYRRKYYWSHLEECRKAGREYSKKYYRTHKDQVRIKTREWRRAHPEETRLYRMRAKLKKAKLALSKA